MKIVIATDYTKTPGFRFRSDGPFSGQEFRERFLEPLFDDKKNQDSIEIDLDGVAGYATSFLEEAFGGLARKYGIEKVEERLVFITKDEPLLKDEIKSYIRNCNEKK